MKTRTSPLPGQAFTLVELLVVIAIIGVLAGLLLTIMPSVMGRGSVRAATSELAQIVTAIEAYKSKYGFYPPDNPSNVLLNPLYFELVGTTNNGTIYVALDGVRRAATNQLAANVGVNGIVNSSTDRNGSDEKPAPRSFLTDLKVNRIGTNNGVALLVCSQDWSGPGSPIPGSPMNPWRYNSSHPTNNPGSYDLWVDLYIDGKTQRVSNWRN